MATPTSKKIIPFEAIPDKGSKIVTIEKIPYLVMNDAMFTFFQRSMGEFSSFFLALRDDRRILGCKCTKCGIVRIPPFTVRCPDCDFAPTETVEVGDVGTMLSTPAITYFATALFQQQVPFGRGRIVLKGADTAMAINVYTTTGIMVPGIVSKGTEMKVVFRDKSAGEITDIFAVPTVELTPQQVAKKGLLESEINWNGAAEPRLATGTAQSAAHLKDALRDLKALAEEMRKCQRARSDIAGWVRSIEVKTGGGHFGIKISNGDLDIVDGAPASPDFVMVCENPAVLKDGLAYRGSLTQAIIDKKLWISKNVEFNTVFKLERMARSLVRSKKT